MNYDKALKRLQKIIRQDRMSLSKCVVTKVVPDGTKYDRKKLKKISDEDK